MPARGGAGGSASLGGAGVVAGGGGVLCWMSCVYSLAPVPLALAPAPNGDPAPGAPRLGATGARKVGMVRIGTIAGELATAAGGVGDDGAAGPPAGAAPEPPLANAASGSLPPADSGAPRAPSAPVALPGALPDPPGDSGGNGPDGGSDAGAGEKASPDASPDAGGAVGAAGGKATSGADAGDGAGVGGPSGAPGVTSGDGDAPASGAGVGAWNISVNSPGASGGALGGGGLTGAAAGAAAGVVISRGVSGGEAAGAPNICVKLPGGIGGAGVGGGTGGGAVFAVASDRCRFTRPPTTNSRVNSPGGASPPTVNSIACGGSVSVSRTGSLLGSRPASRCALDAPPAAGKSGDSAGLDSSPRRSSPRCAAIHAGNERSPGMNSVTTANPVGSVVVSRTLARSAFGSRARRRSIVTPASGPARSVRWTITTRSVATSCALCVRIPSACATTLSRR